METKTIYIVEVVIYDHYDNNLWSKVTPFTDKKKAQAFFRQESKTCYDEARGKDMSDNPREYYSVEKKCWSDTKRECVRECDTPQHYKVELSKHVMAA